MSKQRAVVHMPVGAGKAGWINSIPPIVSTPLPPGAVPVYSGANSGSLTLSAAGGIFSEGVDVKPLDAIINVGHSKCDGMGCKSGKVLLLNKTVDCDKCKGTGTL